MGQRVGQRVGQSRTLMESVIIRRDGCGSKDTRHAL